MRINIGDVLDSKYRVLRRLGAGGFGEVYLAEDRTAGRQVAIKLLQGQDPGDQDHLVDEMRSLNKLHHPNIVSFYHHFASKEVLFLVMEYCAGGSLRDKMGQHPAPLHTIMQWGKDLADTLHFVHGRGIVHHDIKPHNILITSHGVLKIGDFGLANRRGGTDFYLAPETRSGEVDTADVRVDVYALGITLLELLRNDHPFAGMSRNETQRAKMRHEFIPLDLEPWVQYLIAKATHPTPELRFQSMQEFREAIDSKHVSYVFDRSRVQAHALAAKAEKLLARKRLSAAWKLITQALYACPDCVSALIAAGRYKLFINRIGEAKEHFDDALTLNPRTNIQKELGWLALEACKYSQAISLLTDHLQRNAADYEAFNLLLECFYRTERYELGEQVATLMVGEKAPSGCFANNALLCFLLSEFTDSDFSEQTREKERNPFTRYNQEIWMSDVWKQETTRRTPAQQLKSLLLFENYRFGLPRQEENILTIEAEGLAQELTESVITVGRLPENRISLSDRCISRRHCVIVNYPDDVWIYDLDSTQGVFVDGERVDRKVYLQGVHVLNIGETELTIRSKPGLLV